MSASLAVASSSAIGRFELRRELGRGAQATVWLAFDPRLEREVALKLTSAEAHVDPTAVGAWLAEARSVARLSHPNIVPLFEAAEHEHRPYLVFEYVPGPTLAQHLRQRGTLPPHVAVPMAIGVLDALAAAHADGIVHRDVKPSNILVDQHGRCRVMDFGIAARLHDPGSRDQVVGTPGYMSPEAAEGGLPSAAMDVFSVGLVLIEMLAGERVVAERDPYRAMARVAAGDLPLPATLPASVDDALRTVLRRAIACDPAERWPDAETFRRALQQWLVPPELDADPAGEGAEAGPSATSGTLEFLLRRMRRRADFPALSDSIARIQRVAASEEQSVASLSAEILRDVALTQKLLRYVNSAHFGSETGGVATVSRAVALIGFGGVRNLAMSLVLLEHLHDKAHATQLKEDFLRSLLAAMLGAEFATAGRSNEEAFIGSMFQSLGRLLAGFYFPEEAELVRGLLASGSSEAPVNEDSAAASVLGISYQELGLGVARHWGLPPELRAAMRKPVGEPPRQPRDAAERSRWSALAANQIADALYRAEPKQAASKVGEVARRYARTLGLSAEAIGEVAEVARRRLATMVSALELSVPADSPAHRLLPAATATAPSPVASRPAVGATTATATLRLATPDEVPTALVFDPTRAAPAPDAIEQLAAGVQRITDVIVGDFKLDDVLRLVLDTMQQALRFDRVVFSLRDPKTDTLTGRLGVGCGVERVVAAFALTLKSVPDLFNAVCLKGVDTLIADAAIVASRLPVWYRSGIGAPSFLLLPVLVNKAPLGLIYADRTGGGPIELAERELALLRTLRNQVVMAFRQVR